MDFAKVFMVGFKIIYEGAGQSQGLQQAMDLLFQAALVVNNGPKGFGDTQVFPQNKYIHLKTGDGSWDTRQEQSLKYAFP